MFDMTPLPPPPKKEPLLARVSCKKVQTMVAKQWTHSSILPHLRHNLPDGQCVNNSVFTPHTIQNKCKNCYRNAHHAS